MPQQPSSYQFIFTESFQHQLKHLAKKNKNIDKDLLEFLESFDPELGAVIPGMKGARKIRVKMQGFGKSKSYRVIYYLSIKTRVFFLDIYVKGEQTDISPEQAKKIKAIIEELGI
ncbi:MAG: type II toxin-antitoxin system RelE/ParE family toxin [Candidatus Kapaibacterium sp.]